MKRTLVVVATGTLLALSSSSAIASCMEPPSLGEAIGQAPAVFVGTVVALDEVTVRLGPEEAIGETEWVTRRQLDPRRATVRVDEVWKGDPLPDEVKVYGGPPNDDPSWFSTVDRAFTIGTRYLFVPHEGGPPFRDSACSNTHEYADGLMKAVAAGGDDVSAQGRSRPWSAWPTVTAALGGTLLLAAGLRRSWRRRREIT